MKKVLPLLFLLGACAPDIAQNPPPSGNAIIAQFDPGNANVAIVPAPNDLALTTGKVVVPIPNGCQDLTDPANPKPVHAANAPATSTNGVKDADETDVDCGGTSTNACDVDKTCNLAEDCASTICTNGKCVGGCPSAAQQELNTKYLGTLNGFPFESTASCSFSAELNPGSVTNLSVLGIDITDPANPVGLTPDQFKPTYGNKQIFVAPPAGGWTRGHKYAVVVIGGDTGVKGPNGEAVIGSQTWELVRSHNPLITCADLKTETGCGTPNVDVLPSKETDPNARLKEQTHLAAQLEQIRQGYDQILSALEAKNITQRANVPLLWTFTIVDAGEVTFDPAASTIPFPNDILRDVAKDTDTVQGKVQMPNPHTFKPLTDAECASTTDQNVLLFCGLNTLDGFSTTVAPVSENGDKADAVSQAKIDKSSLTPQTVGLAKIKSRAPAGEQTDPKFTPCLNCESTPDANGAPQTSPQQLQWHLDVPLDERTQYLAYVTGDVKDDKGKNVVASPAFALLRSTQPLVDAGGHTTVSLITDEQAQQLEPLRAAMKPALDGLEAKGLKRENLTLAFAFTTQSEATILDQLHTLPTVAGAVSGLPDFPLGFVDVTATYQGAATAAGITNIDFAGGVKVFSGFLASPELVTGVQGTFNPDPTKAKGELVPYVVMVPKGPYPATGFPVTIFGHGLTRNRNDFLALGGALTAAGQVVIAIDMLYHGDRSTCTGSKSATAAALPAGVQPSDDFACAAPAAAGGNMTCDEGDVQGLCILTSGTRDACAYGKLDPTGDLGCLQKGQGRCAADNKCQGAGADLARDASGAAKISGWNYFNLTNFFATRDNFRQQVIDLAQVVRVLKGTKTGPPPAPTSLETLLQGSLASATPVFDATKVNYVGQSQGGIDGALFNAASPDTLNVALNVAGGKLVQLFLLSPTLAPQRKALVDTLGAAGISQGTPAFDTFLGLAQWILDEADPVNMGYRLTHPVTLSTGGSAPPANRKVFLQFIEKDQFVVNEANLSLVQGANRNFVPTPPSFGCTAPLFCWEFVEAGAKSSNPAGLDSPPFDATSAPLANRHGFLLKPPSATAAGLAITQAAQKQVATFLATGVGP